jgi:hypothetical protein
VGQQSGGTVLSVHPSAVAKLLAYRVLDIHRPCLATESQSLARPLQLFCPMLCHDDHCLLRYALIFSSIVTLSEPASGRQPVSEDRVGFGDQLV